MALPDEAQTRTEQYLDYIAKNGTGGGSGAEVPAKLSQLEDDSEHRTVTDAEKEAWNNKSDFSGKYDDLSGKPTIPTVPAEEIAANTKARHTHDNKAVLDGITADKVAEWDDKSEVIVDDTLTESGQAADSKTTGDKLTDIQADIANLMAYAGLAGDDVAGMQVDYENKTFKRLAGAEGLSAGSDFNKFQMYGGQKKCNVADDGTINAWYGDDGYAEDGSNGQVMKYYPKFYYLIVPVEIEKNEDTGIGYHARKVNYYVSDTYKPGFKVHPAFFDADGNEVEYILRGAYEASIWDADGGGDGAGAYLTKDEQVMNTATDKLCSIAGVKPASGLSQNLTQPNIEILAQNRGEERHGDLIKSISAVQLLMIIELGTMNTQTGVGQGAVSITNNSAYNCSSLTGSTASLGEGTGSAAATTNEIGGTETEYTAAGKVSVAWRGEENIWGNIWKFIYGVNIWGNGSMGGGEPYICKDFNFAESKNSDNYEGVGFTVTNASGYISAMGYSPEYDYLFIASECKGSSNSPVGDYTYTTANLSGYRTARLGGSWGSGAVAGGFCWSLANGVGYRNRALGGRLVYIPKKDSTVYTAAISSWKAKMAA